MRTYICIDRVGERYGYLTILRAAPTLKDENKKWVCMCDCGKETIVRVDHLRDGSTSSCGCKRSDKIRAAVTRHGYSKNKSFESEYWTWTGIHQRCYNKKACSYYNYGARGIKVCKRWSGENGFINFISDMGRKPSKYHSIDRIRNNSDYKPSNCRWATAHAQGRNKRSNRWLVYRGRKMTIGDWAKELGVERALLYNYLQRHSFKKVIAIIQYKQQIESI